MKKQLLLMITTVLIAQSLSAARAWEDFIPQTAHDLLRLFYPTFTMGKKLPVYKMAKDSQGSLLFNDGSPILVLGIKASQQEIQEQKIPLKQDAAGEWFLADEIDKNEFKVYVAPQQNNNATPNPVDKKDIKCPVVEIISAETIKAGIIKKRGDEFYSPFLKKLYDIKMGWYLEKPYFGAFWIATIYGAVKVIQKLNTYNEDKGIDFDDFADEEEPVIVQKIDSVSPSVSSESAQQIT